MTGRPQARLNVGSEPSEEVRVKATSFANKKLDTSVIDSELPPDFWRVLSGALPLTEAHPQRKSGLLL